MNLNAFGMTDWSLTSNAFSYEICYETESENIKYFSFT